MSMTDPTPQTRETSVDQLPPSCKLVWYALRVDGPLPRSELMAETRLSPDTTRYATTRLEREGIIERDTAPGDARQLVFSLPEQHTNG